MGFNPNAEIMSCIQKSISKKIYFDVDIDENDDDKLIDTIGKVKSFINPDCLTFVRTRGGVHCLIKLSDVHPDFKKSWHKNITSLPGVDQCSDMLLPVVGGIQGGYVPKFMAYD